MSAGSKEEGYKSYQVHAHFFKEAIEKIMAGEEPELATLVSAYIRANKVRDEEDMFASFQSEGRTLLHVAASSGHATMVDFVLGKFRDQNKKRYIVNKADDRGFTSLINATISECDESISILLKAGADVHAKNKDNATAAHFAAGDGSVSRLQTLLDAGCDINTMSKAGGLLHWAAGKARNDVIKYLLKRGIDVNRLNSEGMPPVIMTAVASNDIGVKYLVEAGADIGFVVTGNLTALHIASENGLLDAVSAIIQTPKGIDCCQVATADGNLPLHLAAMAGHEAVARVLLPVTRRVGSEGDASAGAFYGPDDMTAIMADGAQRMRLWEEGNRQEKLLEEQRHEQELGVQRSSRVLEPTDPPCSVQAQAESEEHKQLGNTHYLKKDYARAVEEYSQAIRLCGNNTMLWSNRSACYLVMNDPANALLDAEVCRRLDANWPKGCFRLAQARLALGLYEDAAVAAFEGCRLDEANAELKKILQTAVKMGQEEHQRRLAK